LFGDKGALGEATVGSFALLGRIVKWDLALAEMWDASSVVLVARLEGDAKMRAQARWARAAMLPVPIVSAARKPDAAQRAAVMAALRGLDAYKQLQAEWSRWAKEHPAEDPAPRKVWHGEPEIRVLAAGVAKPLISVSVAQRGLCNEFSGSSWAVWEVDGAKLTLRNRPSPGLYLQPVAAVDLDGNGKLEILYEGLEDESRGNASGQPGRNDYGIIRLAGELYEDIEGLALPVFVCPC
jgi:hypothetical protein